MFLESCVIQIVMSNYADRFIMLDFQQCPCFLHAAFGAQNSIKLSGQLLVSVAASD